MDWNLKKVWPLATIALASMTSMLSAASATQTGDCGTTCGKNPGTATATPPSARPITVNNCCCRSWYLDAEVLFWKATEDGLSPAIVNVELADTNTIEIPNDGVSMFTNAKFVEPSAKWDAGFRFGIGYNAQHDDWDVYAVWTHFRNHTTSDVEANADAFPQEVVYANWSAFNTQTNAMVPVAEERSNWSLRLNMIDLELGRKFFAGKWLTLRPFIGLRGALIHQTFNIDYYPGNGLNAASNPYTGFGTIEEVRMKNNFSGVGPRSGINTQWNLGCGWSIYGDAAISLVYGTFDIDQAEYNGPSQESEDTVLNIAHNYHATRAITDLALGLRYEQCCFDANNYVTVSLGWEHHMFFNQNQMNMYYTTESLTGLLAVTKATRWTPARGDLATQGLTLAFRFDF
jgi:hypothetical protein